MYRYKADEERVPQHTGVCEDTRDEDNAVTAQKTKQNEEVRSVHTTIIHRTVLRDPSGGRIHTDDAVPMAVH